ncbi:MoxR family ATPase [Actinomyces sp. zg-332]|uniref:AAA family ATPase n=1 Tax=Actinomyces sp. zg-332 TaxID=2708340 RepID=UPI00142161F6|nr:MoxR family ATPase [Actinomyces sp. zg-332]QPK94627.1 MoxR family ATPase [Actinomyces sp. zg-332]
MENNNIDNSQEQNTDVRKQLSEIRTQISKTVVGQDSALTGLVIGLLIDGHILLEGVPGVGKTLLAKTLAQTLNLSFKRIQFTPDLMPSDITGSLLYDDNEKDFVLKHGPIFTNIVLADEINRTPAKTQSALLEAMEERQVSVNGQSLPLPKPFMVIATQNPIEYEGTYALPEAQLDRFAMKITMQLPNKKDELEILSKQDKSINGESFNAVLKLADADMISEAKAQMSTVKISVDLLGYIVDIIQATRNNPNILLGASPRGSITLLKASKAWAWLNGRNYVTPDDIKIMAKPTLTHRIKLHSEAEIEGVLPSTVIQSIIQNITVPR